MLLEFIVAAQSYASLLVQSKLFKFKGHRHAVPRGPSMEAGCAALRGKEASKTCFGPTRGLSQHLTQRQLPRLDHLVARVERNAVPAQRAATLQRLRVVVRCGIGKRHCPFATQKPDNLRGKFHYSPVSFRDGGLAIFHNNINKRKSQYRRLRFRLLRLV